VESVLQEVEVIAGPPLLIAVFFGTLLIGLKASDPVEVARRRQLEFTADASHELRTPLSVIEAEVTLALQGKRGDREYRGSLERVRQEGLRLRTIVENLLWLSRFDAEPPPPGEEPVDVSAVAAACADRFTAVAQGSGIDLTVREHSLGPPWINAAPEWIDRVVAVLVDNACRHAGQDGQVLIAVTADANRELGRRGQRPRHPGRGAFQAFRPIPPRDRRRERSWFGSRHSGLCGASNRWSVAGRRLIVGRRSDGGLLAPLPGF